MSDADSAGKGLRVFRFRVGAVEWEGDGWEIAEAVDRGDISPDAEVWDERSGTWTPFSEMEETLRIFVAEPPEADGPEKSDPQPIPDEPEIPAAQPVGPTALEFLEVNTELERKLVEIRARGMMIPGLSKSDRSLLIEDRLAGVPFMDSLRRRVPELLIQPDSAAMPPERPPDIPPPATQKKKDPGCLMALALFVVIALLFFFFR